MNVSVFGLGSLGCVTAACLARAGHRVIGVDSSADTVELVNAGFAPVTEPGLEDLLATVVGTRRLEATTDVGHAVAATDIALICVGAHNLDGRPDVTAIERVGREIGHALTGRLRPFTVLLRSTVLPGTTEGVLTPALNGSVAAAGVKVGTNPAFLREGFAIRDFEAPPLVLVGCADMATASLVRELYGAVSAPFVETSVRTAELVRHASAAFHVLKICFANEIGRLSEALGADAQEVMRIFSMDRRLNLSDAYLRPGFAFGGRALPRDVQALIQVARDQQIEVPLLSAIAPSNDNQIRAAVEAVIRSGRQRVGVVGFPFRSGADRLAENPVATLVETLVSRGLDLRVLDGNLSRAHRNGSRAEIDHAMPYLGPILCHELETLVDHVDVLVIGRATREAAAALALIDPDCVVIDLTGGTVYDAQRDDDGDPAAHGPVRTVQS